MNHHRSTIALATIAAALTLVLLGPAAHAADDLDIQASPSIIDIDLGDLTNIELTITNNTENTISDAVAHIDIVDLSTDGSADAEDWSSTLNKPVPLIPPGESATLSWDIQPITPGTYSLYAVALDPNSTAVAVTDTVTINVTDKRSLNPNGILPVAIAIPTLVGLALATRHRRHLTL